MGYALYVAQQGGKHRDAKPLKGFGGAGVVEIVSDFDRQQYGLTPRGPDGWTMEEIVELEKRRLELMFAPMPTHVMPR